MTDEEIICGWMEPKPPEDSAPLSRTYRGDIFSDGEFWMADEYTTVWHVVPLTLDLDALHLVEARLTDIQWATYQLALASVIDPKKRISEQELLAMRPWVWKLFQHASAEQKIKALAAVLREGR